MLSYVHIILLQCTARATNLKGNYIKALHHSATRNKERSKENVSGWWFSDLRLSHQCKATFSLIQAAMPSSKTCEMLQCLANPSALVGLMP